MIYYPRDSTIELRDPQKNNVHLKRVPVSRNISKSLFIGSQFVLFSRHLRILDSANEKTAAYLSVSMEPVICCFKATDIMARLPETLQLLLDSGLILAQCKLLGLDGTLDDRLNSLAVQVAFEGDRSVMSASSVAFFVLRGSNAGQQ